MAGTFTKKYTFTEPLHLPLFVKVVFLVDGNILGETTKLVDSYGEKSFSITTNRQDVNSTVGMTNQILFQNGDTWDAGVYKRISPYSFSFPFCFSGFKFGWR